MLILLDCSPKKITEYSKKYKYQFGQLRTPLTGYKWCERPYAIDNGAFTKFNYRGWLRLIEQARLFVPRPFFVACPDIVGDARRTLELYQHFSIQLGGLPRALVLQDGIENLKIPWDNLEAIFIGGTNEFKESKIAKDCCKTAKILGKWTHVGRVNTAKRVAEYAGLADSIDGSGISRFDHMLKSVLSSVKKLPLEQRVCIRNLSCAESGGLIRRSKNLSNKKKLKLNENVKSM